MKSRMIWLMLAVTLTALLCCVSAFAVEIVASGTCGANGDSLTWTLDDEGTLMVNGIGKMADYNYSSILAPWYSKRLKIKCVNLSNSVTSIGNCAFYKCVNLTNIIIPDSVTSIGFMAFSSCDNLTSINISSTVSNIGNSAFSNCTKLNNISISNNNEYYSSVDGVLFNKTITELICYPAGKTNTEYVIPSYVTCIRSSAFYNNSQLQTLIIPDSLTDLGDNTFSCCTSLTSINIPQSVTIIDDATFYFCSKLESILLPDKITSIGDSAFSGCSSLVSS